MSPCSLRQAYFSGLQPKRCHLPTPLSPLITQALVMPLPLSLSLNSLCSLPAQRGDAEVSQKLWRVVRACVELGEKNPIQQIHDQGAGGNCNVVKEIIYPLGEAARLVSACVSPVWPKLVCVSCVCVYRS